MIPGGVLAEVLTEAWIRIGAFVIASVLVVQFIGRYTASRVVGVLGDRPRVQVLGGGLLGLVPGCGGAIAVTSLYADGRVGFGVLVAALAATAGDSAFVLLVVDARLAVIAYGVACAVGVGLGVAIETHGVWVDRIDGAVRQAGGRRQLRSDGGSPAARRDRSDAHAGVMIVWWSAAAVSLVAGMWGLFVGDLPEAGTGEKLLLVVAVAGIAASAVLVVRSGPTEPETPLGRYTARTVAPIVLWIAVAVGGFELLMSAVSVDPAGIAELVGPFAPIGAGVFGAIPGCGPHIGLVTAHAELGLPASVLIADAVNQDGDALFSLLAADPAAAVVATIYTTVAAVATGVGVYATVGLFL
ncbi:MAG: protein of unknown function (DUF2899) [halophilic archaeon J07HX5]|nr:MAG: protein of unknown function (DUF2899) [halophilic archaeon J07HX5]